jgi:hypothetical protein
MKKERKENEIMAIAYEMIIIESVMYVIMAKSMCNDNINGVIII